MRLTSLVRGFLVEVRGGLGERPYQVFFGRMGENVTFFFVEDGRVVDCYE